MSKYVNEEIRYFKQLGKGRNIYAAIVDGEPHAAGNPNYTTADECFPPALIYCLGHSGAISATPEPNEPIAADFREGKDGRENGSLKLIAGLLGVPLDELVQREKQAERRRRLRANAIAAAMALLAAAALIGGGFAWWQRDLAEQRRAEANAQRAIAEEQRGEAVNQRRRAEYQSQRAEIQRLAAVASEMTATAERDRAREALSRVFETRIWDAMAIRAYDRAARYALAMALEFPGQREAARVALSSQFMSRAEVLANLEGHDSFVVSAAFTADGRRALTGSYDGSAVLWDVASGEELRRIRGSSFRLVDAQISRDGARIVTVPDNLGPGEDRVSIWDGESGALLARLPEDVDETILSADGSKLLTTASDNSATIWDAGTGQPMQHLEGHSDRINAVAFSPDSRSAATASWDGTTRVWDVASGRRLLTLGGHTNSVAGVVFSGDGTKIATRSADFSIIVWDATNGQILNRLVSEDGIFSAMVFSSDGGLLATGSLGGAVTVWRLGAPAAVVSRSEHREGVTSISFSADAREVLTASDDHTARLWNAATGDEIAEFEGHNDKVTVARFSPDGTQVLTASQDGSARLWSALPRAHRAWNAHSQSMLAFSVSRNRRWITTGDVAGNVSLWDARTGDLVRSVQIGDQVDAVAASPDARRIAAVIRSGEGRIWDTTSGNSVTFQGAVNGTGLEFAPDGNSLASGTWLFDSMTGLRQASARETAGLVASSTFDGTGAHILFAEEVEPLAWVWSSSQRRRVLQIRSDGPLRNAVFDPEGTRILTGGATASIWRSADGRELLRLPVGNRTIARATFSPDGREVLTALLAGDMLVWDSHTGRLIAHLPAGADTLIGAEFGEGGKSIIEAYANGLVRITDTNWLARSWEELRDYTCSRRLTRDQREFTQDEQAEDPLIGEVFLGARGASRSVCRD